ncbi:MAG: GNAT family N-acetyltransferase [Firmicutes bacterium]|nr:GNAT family N-acetyltransferase [Bacillota bacterium]
MRLCFVCTSNEDRSPMAEVIARHQVQQSGLAWTVCSAGTEGVDGAPICEEAEIVCAEFGLPLAGKTQQGLNAGLISDDTIFVAMEEEHRDVLLGFGVEEDRIFVFGGGVRQPRPGHLDTYRICYGELVTEVGILIRLLRSMEREKVRLYLVRSAESDLTIKDDQRRPLTAKGTADARKITATLQNKGITKVYSSPSVRAVDTVKNLADTLGLEIVKVDHLRNWDVGVCMDDFHRCAQSLWKDFSARNLGGESLAEVEARCSDVLKTIVEENLGSSVVVATHGTPLSMMINYVKSDFGYEGFLKLMDQRPYIVCLTLEGTKLVSFEEIYFGASELTYRTSITTAEVNSIRQSLGFRQIHPEQLRAGLVGSTYLLAAYEGERAVGFARLVWDGGSVALIPDILVRPEFQGRGIEARLVRRLLDFLRAKLKPGWGIQVDIRAWNEPGLYESFGFEITRPERRGLPMHVSLTHHSRHGASVLRE